MADIYGKGKRSAVMRSIRGKGNKTTELTLITVFKNQGIGGWRRGYPVKGHPDFVFLKGHIAIFVDGCFWHGHDCRNTRPKDNEDFWKKKIGCNIDRDKSITAMFEHRGWTVLRIWECEHKKKNRNALLDKLVLLLK